MGSTVREQRVAEIRRLRDDEGLLLREIAERLGLAVSTVHDYYSDPDGSKARARKAKNNGRCVDCGAETRNSGSAAYVPERCRPCALARSKTPEARARYRGSGRPVRWTDEQIFAAMRSAAVDGVLTANRYRAVYARRRRGSIPSYATIQQRFDRWAVAVKAAGLRSPYGDGYGPRSDRTPTAGLVLAIGECVEALGLDRPPTANEYNGWAQSVGAPSESLLRIRFGSWCAATDAYEAAQAVDMAVAA